MQQYDVAFLYYVTGVDKDGEGWEIFIELPTSLPFIPESVKSPNAPTYLIPLPQDGGTDYIPVRAHSMVWHVTRKRFEITCYGSSGHEGDDGWSREEFLKRASKLGWREDADLQEEGEEPCL